MTVQNMSGFRKTCIFPFDADIALPRYSTDELQPTVAAINYEGTSRLAPSQFYFRRKLQHLRMLRKVQMNHYRRIEKQLFVPPFGAAITEPTFRDMIKEKELEIQKTKPPNKYH